LYNLLLEAEVDPNLAKYIIMYRQNGGSTKSGSTPSLSGALKALVGGTTSTASAAAAVGDVGQYQLTYDKSGKTQFKSIFDLINTYVTITTTVPDPTGKPGATKQVTTVYASPVNDVASPRTLLPALFKVATLVQTTEIPARVNVNTASSAVLTALPGLQATDVQTILTGRPDATNGDTFSEIYETPVWLLTEAQLSVQTLQALDQYITTRSQVYRVQAVGYFDGAKGPSIRLEAVIDTNAGRPRILAWRTLSELGKGWTPGNNTAATPTPSTNP
jgi:hypothetical protein